MRPRNLEAWAAITAMPALANCAAYSSEGTDTSEGKPAALAPSLSPPTQDHIQALLEPLRGTVWHDGTASGSDHLAFARPDGKAGAIIGADVEPFPIGPIPDTISHPDAPDAKDIVASEGLASALLQYTQAANRIAGKEILVVK